MAPEPSFEESVDVVRARAEALLLRCKVPKGLQDPHRLVAALLDEDLARRKAIETDRLAWQRPRFDSPAALRRLRIVNALFIAMAHAGCQASASSKELDRVGFRIGDTFVPIEIGPANKGGRAGKNLGSAPEQSLSIKVVGWPGITDVPSSWVEGEGKRIEDRIIEIARDLLVFGELAYRALVREQYEWSRERRRKREAEAQAARERIEQEEKSRRLREAAARLDWLLGQAANRRQADDIRALVEAVDVNHLELAGQDPAGTYLAWRSWALAQADLLDPCHRALAALVNPPSAQEPGNPGKTLASRHADISRK